MIPLWRHIYGERSGILGLFSGARPEPGSKRLGHTRTAYFAWPAERKQARLWSEREAAAGREVYHCAHLLTAKRRIKENAAPLSALYVDGDGARVNYWLPSPTAIVESSPGREQYYWRLTKLVTPEAGEQLNRRLAHAAGADKSGWDLTQLLRPPGTSNHKYQETLPVVLREIREVAYDPAELDRILPSLPEEETREATMSGRPKNVGHSPDLSRLSRRMQDLIRYGNCGEYECRSRADMAVCVAMFAAGYAEAEVWAVMTDSSNGISDKFLEKGYQGERYLTLTIGKAKARTEVSRRRKPSRSKARRVYKGIARG